MNVFDFAMQRELDSKAHYKRLEAETPVAELKKIFAIFAADEMHHYAVVSAMKKEHSAESANYPTLEDARAALRALEVDEKLLRSLQTRKDCFRHAMKMEKESIRLYEAVAERETRENGQGNLSHLKRIIEEEKKHYHLVGKIYDLLNRYE